MSSRASLAVVALLLAMAALLASTSIARASKLAEPRAADVQHRVRRAPELQVSFHFGTNQALSTGGFNAAHDLRVGQLRFAYARGERLDRRMVRSVVSEVRDAPELGMVEAISAGASLAAAVTERMYVAADVKVETIDIYAGSENSHARSLTAGIEVGWRVHLWRGAYLAPSVRLWPEVWDDVPDGGVVIESASGQRLGATPASDVDSGVLANVMLGWELGR